MIQTKSCFDSLLEHGKECKIKLKAYYSKEAALDIINSSAINKNDLQILKRILKEIDNDGFVESDYVYSKGLTFGRLISTRNSYQHLSRNTRARCSDGRYTYIDVVNCHPVILAQLFEKYSIPCDTLKEYVNNREIHIEIIMQKYSLSESEVKKLLLLILHGGDYKKHTNNHSDKFLDEFEKDNENGILELVKHDLKIQKMMRIAQKRNKSRPIMTAVNWLIQDYVMAITCLLGDYISNNNFGSVDCFIADACLVRDLQDNVNILSQLSDHVYEIMQLRVMFARKLMV